MSNLFTTGTTASTTATFNFPIFISGSNGQTWWWDFTTGTGTAAFPTIINPSPLIQQPFHGGGITVKKLTGTDIDYEDCELIFKVKKGKIFKLFDWFIYERMKLEGKIKEID